MFMARTNETFFWGHIHSVVKPEISLLRVLHFETGSDIQVMEASNLFAADFLLLKTWCGGCPEHFYAVNLVTQMNW